MRHATLASLLILALSLGACESPVTKPGVSTPSTNTPTSANESRQKIIVHQASPSVAPSKVTAPQAESKISCDGIEERIDIEGAENNIAFDLWPWGVAAAWTFTVDEGVAEPYDLLMPELEVYGWRASFFIYTKQPDQNTWNRIRLAHQRGHEVSNHTLTHPDLTTLSDEKIHDELKLANDELRKQLGELSLQSFAYPFEATDERTWSIVKQYHRYARSGDHGAAVPPFPINDARNPKWGELTAKAPTLGYSVDDWNTWVDAAVDAKGWFIDELHGVEDDGVVGGWEPRTLEEFRNHFNYIQKHPKGLWVATMGEVGNYIEERENVKTSVSAWHKDGLKFTLEDGFDHSLDYKQGLTFTLKLPDGLKSDKLQVIQGGKPAEFKVLDSNTLHIQAEPDKNQTVCILPLI